MNLAPPMLFAIVLLLWTLGVLTVALATLYKRWRLVRRDKQIPVVSLSRTRCLLIRPCAGLEPHLAQCISSITAARYSFELEVVLGFNSASDEALPTARDVCQTVEQAGIPCQIQIAPVFGPNRKVTILEECTVDSEAFDVILSADSNVDLTDVNLDRLVEPMAGNPTVGAVWVPPVEQSSHSGLGSRTSRGILNGSWHAFGLLSAIDPHGMVGKLFAIQTAALREIGGFKVLVDYLGEDMALVQHLARQGYQVIPRPDVVVSLSTSGSFRETVERHKRWMMVIRAQRPGLVAAYPLLFASAPIIVLLSLASLPFHWPAAMASLLLTLVARVIIGIAARRVSRQTISVRGLATDMVLADIALLWAFIRTLGSRNIFWRGVSLRVGQDGRLREVSPGPKR